MRTDENFKITDWLGKPEQEVRRAAHAAGYSSRVVEEDGRFFTVTRDYNTNRLNLRVAKGIVYQIDVG